jgi:thiol-disulfide isomerase/thioredoxin
VGEGFFERLLGEYEAFLPRLPFLPDLSPEDVARFAALGEEGRRRLREGDVAAAEAAFREQVRIFPPNPDPHVWLGTIAAMRGDKKAALDRLRAAVVRGFTDLRRLERAEGWQKVRGHPDFLALEDAVPRLLEIERRWAGWDAFRAGRVPEDVAGVEREYLLRKGVFEAMEPALGPRLKRLWDRVNERATAALLEAYVSEKPRATDLDKALERLLSLYSGGPLFRWEVLPGDVARRLGSVAKAALERFREGPLRAGALASKALSAYSDRDGRGALRPEAADEIRVALEEVLSRHRGSPFVPAAVEGLVRTELDLGRSDRAAAAFEAFRSAYGSDREVREEVLRRLGSLALVVGGVPEFRATDLDGRPLAAEALRGRVSVLHFWATWCPPCVEELPVLRRIAERYGDRVLLVGVSLDESEDLPAAEFRAWIARQAVAGRHIYDGLGWESDLVRAFGVTEIPFNVVVGRDGKVVAVGEHGRRLEKTVKAALD